MYEYDVNGYSQFPAYDYRSGSDEQTIADLQKAISGEYSAVLCYEALANLAPVQAVREQILEIRKDEIKHYEIFSGLYTHLTGRPPAPEITEPCPAVYRAGLNFAFKDEQETVDFYLEAADRARLPFIQEALRRAAADEQNHAVWFLYFLQGAG